MHPFNSIHPVQLSFMNHDLLFLFIFNFTFTFCNVIRT
jgi:hypothetical protein